jgi:NAD(P)-dependent dehydrogenase (short-subunit alcohol dehydrogenase family)
MAGSSASSTALIVGASRGLGLGLAQEYWKRGWQVIATARDTRQRTGLQELAEKAGGRVEIESLEINAPDQIVALRSRLAGRRLELLFISAGVANDPATPIGAVSTDEFVRVMVTNALSPMRVIEALQDLVPPTGTIGAMSSGLGSVADNLSGGWEVYRASKAALNTLMRSFAVRQPNDRRSFLVIAPGWVRTDMGGPDAPLDVETSIAGVADTIYSWSGRPGVHYLDYRGETVHW